MCERYYYKPLFVNFKLLNSALMYGQYSRAVYNQERVEMARLVPNEAGKLETGCRGGGVHLKILSERGGHIK